MNSFDDWLRENGRGYDESEEAVRLSRLIEMAAGPVERLRADLISIKEHVQGRFQVVNVQQQAIDITASISETQIVIRGMSGTGPAGALDAVQRVSRSANAWQIDGIYERFAVDDDGYLWTPAQIVVKLVGYYQLTDGGAVGDEPTVSVASHIRWDEVAVGRLMAGVSLLDVSINGEPHTGPLHTNHSLTRWGDPPVSVWYNGLPRHLWLRDPEDSWSTSWIGNERLDADRLLSQPAAKLQLTMARPSADRAETVANVVFTRLRNALEFGGGPR